MGLTPRTGLVVALAQKPATTRTRVERREVTALTEAMQTAREAITSQGAVVAQVPLGLMQPPLRVGTVAQVLRVMESRQRHRPTRVAVVVPLLWILRGHLPQRVVRVAVVKPIPKMKREPNRVMGAFPIRVAVAAAVALALMAGRVPRAL